MWSANTALAELVDVALFLFASVAIIITTYVM